MSEKNDKAKLDAIKKMDAEKKRKLVKREIVKK